MQQSFKNKAITNLKIQNLLTFHLPASQPATQPASLPYIRPSCARCMAQEFLLSKGNHVKTAVLKNVYPLHHGAFFYPLLVS